jgi:hypothetical protein
MAASFRALFNAIINALITSSQLMVQDARYGEVVRAGWTGLLTLLTLLTANRKFENLPYYSK